jgi:hypothetical protein
VHSHGHVAFPTEVQALAEVQAPAAGSAAVHYAEVQERVAGDYGCSSKEWLGMTTVVSDGQLQEAA